MVRSVMLTVVAGAALLLTGCGSSYDQVSQGWNGSTSPAESGLYGASGDQAPLYGAEEAAKRQHEIQPITQPLTNDNIDPTMEGSGNLAAQGNYKTVRQELQKQPSPPIE